MQKWQPVGLWMIVILILSTVSVGNDMNPTWPNLGHFLEYALLSALLFRAVSGTLRTSRLGSSMYAIIAATLYGILMEIVQIFLPRRFFSAEDMVVNFVGATFAVIIMWAIGWRRRLQP